MFGVLEKLLASFRLPIRKSVFAESPNFLVYSTYCRFKHGGVLLTHSLTYGFIAKIVLAEGVASGCSKH